MIRKFLFVSALSLLVLPSCANHSKSNASIVMVEDTKAHDDIFGDINPSQFKLNYNNLLQEGAPLYKPVIGFQRKENADNTYSVRFVAAMQSDSDSAYWMRSVHDLNGQIASGKSKKTIEVTTVYSSLNNDGNPLYASEIKADDGSHPFDCFAVYCLLNIPNSFLDYYVDACLTVNNGDDSVVSTVGSFNVADSNKTFDYSLENDTCYLLEVNGEYQNPDNLDDTFASFLDLDLKEDDCLHALKIDKDNLLYARLGYSSLLRSNPDFKSGLDNAVSVKHDGTYNVLLDANNKFSFEKKIYFQGPKWWNDNNAQTIIEGRHNGSVGDSLTMTYINYSQNVHKYYAFMDVSYNTEVQFYRQESGITQNQTGYLSFPTDEKNCYTRYASEVGGAWTIFGEDIPSNFSFNETELNTPQEIHTNDQKRYLNYSGEYYNITSSDLSSFNANGDSDRSAPLPVTINWDYNVPDSRSVNNYSIVFGQEPDLSDGFEVNGTTAKSISFYNAYLGDNYFKVVAHLDNGIEDSSPIKVFKVVTEGPRNLKVGNMPNCRDMGGRTTYAGGKIKQGLIFRTAGNKYDNYTSVNDECKNILRNQLKVKTEINVSNTSTNTVNLGGGVNVIDALMDYGSTPYSNLSRNAEKIRQVMDVLADENNYPVFYHCRIGTDRTGITGMMIGGLLGIPFNEVFQDYCFSNFAPINGQRYPHNPNDTNGDDPAKYIDEILAMPGKNYQEQTYNALLSIGCSSETLNSVINIMTEGNKANLPTTGIIGKGDTLTSTGTRNTDSNYSHPSIYYSLSSGQNVTLIATTSSGQKDIVIYLGSTNSSNSIYLADRISLMIDGAEQTIKNKTLLLAGFGQTQNLKRTGYMFNLFGVYNLSSGQHTIVVSVKTGSTRFNIGTVCIFDHVG